jgi:hypothetical protein
MPDRYGDHAITDYECFPGPLPRGNAVSARTRSGTFRHRRPKRLHYSLVRGLRTLDGKEQSPTAAIVFANGPACFAP